MSEIKVFRVLGEIIKPNLKTIFKKEVRALKTDDVVESVYAEIGSKHRVKRRHIKIHKIEEISPDDVEDPVLQKLLQETEKLADEQEKMRQIAVELQILESTAEAIQSRINFVNAALI